jgi:hypothetical protein
MARKSTRPESLVGGLGSKSVSCVEEEAAELSIALSALGWIGGDGRR